MFKHTDSLKCLVIIPNNSHTNRSESDGDMQPLTSDYRKSNTLHYMVLQEHKINTTININLVNYTSILTKYIQGRKLDAGQT